MVHLGSSANVALAVMVAAASRSQIQIKNLESPSTTPTIGGKIEGAFCRTAITPTVSPFCVL
jgi:hypothetical protein